MAGLQNVWQAWQSVHGDRSMSMLEKTFGQYEYTKDPAYVRDIQMFQQNPNPAMADKILNNWGKYMNVENIKELVSYIKPMSGTPQDIQYQLNKNKLKKSNIETEALPELTEYELRIKRGQADITGTKADWLPKQYELQYDRNQLARDMEVLDLAFKEQTQPSSIEAEIAKANAQAAQGDYQTDYYDKATDIGVPEAKANTEMKELKAQDLENQTAINRLEKALDLGLPGEQVKTEIGKLNTQQLQNIYDQKILEGKIDDAEKIYDYWYAGVKSQGLTDKFNIRETEEAMKKGVPEQNSNLLFLQNKSKIDKINYALENNLSHQEIDTQLAKLNNQEIQALYNQKINQNKLNDAQKIYDFFIRQKQAETETAEYNRDITEDKAWLSGEKTEAMKDMPQSNLRQILGLTNTTGEGGGEGSISAERIIGQTRDGRPIYSGIGGGFITIDPRTGNPRALSDSEYNNATITENYGEKTVDPSLYIYNNPEIQSLYTEQQLNELINSLPRQMNLTDANRVMSMLRQNYDISEILTKRALSDRIAPEQTYNEYINGSNQPQDQTDQSGEQKNVFPNVVVENYVQANEWINNSIDKTPGIDSPEQLRQNINNNLEGYKKRFPNVDFGFILQMLSQ